VKLTDISGTKKEAYLKANIEELESNNKIKVLIACTWGDPKKTGLASGSSS